MGADIRMNWALQIEPPSSLEERAEYVFEKSGNRIFPLETPIDLLNMQRDAVAKIRITEFTNKPGITTGRYEVIKIYQDTEKQVLTQYWRENQ
ncbi:DUF2584 family protein [Candidatus Pacearchaeota archaeon]|nr:DUF2584 family protein [Candidatus Pacearchaeota archaeon]